MELNLRHRREEALSTNKDQGQTTETTASNLFSKRRIRSFYIPSLVLFALACVICLHLSDHTEPDPQIEELATPLDSFQEDWSTDRLNFSDVGKAIEIERCNETIKVYLQFVLEDRRNIKLTNNFNNLVLSIIRKTNCRVMFYVLSNELGKNVIEYMMAMFKTRYSWFVVPTVRFLDYYNTAKDAVVYTKPMKELFAVHTTNYYSKSWFHISPGLHRFLPSSVEKVIALDIDMFVLTDIKHLWWYFKSFDTDQMMAFSSEQQPVYFHVTSSFREKNKNTIIGKPKPHGLPGVNGGVKLLHLDRLRKSRIYNSLIDEPRKLLALADKFSLRGHLGDQDFFTLLSFEFTRWIYLLPCGWNRQLCQWWRFYGYRDIFDLYNDCTLPHYILHGNCNTAIPHKEFYSFL